MYKCHTCSKTFVRPEHLRDHDIAKHSRQYPFRYRSNFMQKQTKSFFSFFSCEYCQKGFLYQNQLYDHYKQCHSCIDQMRNEESNQFIQD